MSFAINHLILSDSIKFKRDLKIYDENTHNMTGIDIVKSYKVSSGDTLSSLAAKFGTTISRLQELNNL